MLSGVSPDQMIIHVPSTQSQHLVFVYNVC